MGQCASTHSLHAKECPREIWAVWRALLLPEENTWRTDNGSSFSSGSSSENDVDNDALFVIGLRGSGDTIALFLQDWEVAKVALGCHIALDMLCQELYEVEMRRGWCGF